MFMLKKKQFRIIWNSKNIQYALHLLLSSAILPDLHFLIVGIEQNFTASF